MRQVLASIFVVMACAPGPARPTAPAQEPVPGDSSAAPEPALVGELVAEPAAPTPAPTKQVAALAAVTLTADPGLRLALEHRGRDFAVAPGRVIALGEDFTELEALDATTGKSQWRSRVQPRPNGRHTLHLQREQLILHAGPTRIHVALADGRVLGSFPASFNGNGLGCTVRVHEGATLADWGTWLAPSKAGPACAESCDCDLRLFDCAAGTAIGQGYRATESHLYDTTGSEHSTECWNRPELVARAATMTIVRVENDRREPTYLGLDAGTGARLWDRSDLGAKLSQFFMIAGTDPDGRLCWLADGEHLEMLDCATGKTRWRATTGDAKTNGRTAAQWHVGDLQIQHRDDKRSTIELREARSGKRRWQRSFAAQQVPLLVGQAPPEFLWTEVGAYVVLDPATGTTSGEITLLAGQTLHAAPEGGYVRTGAGQLAEFDARGKLLRERPLAADRSADGEPEYHVTPQHLVERARASVRVLRRDSLQPVLRLAGSWSLPRSREALGPGALVLVEHRGEEPGRVLVLQPTP